MQSNYDKITAAIDRMQEAHYWLHLMQEHYHQADQFRWYLNVFLKAVKEIPQIVQMELQNTPEFTRWFKDRREELHSDPLIALLGDNRDFIVHRGMLVPRSTGSIGITEGRGMKLGLTFSIHPLEDSDDGMDRYLQYLTENKDFLGILMDDEDSLPCIHREWKIPKIDREILDVSAEAWKRTVSLLDEILRWLGEETVPEAKLDCLHSSQRVQFLVYDRAQLKLKLAGLRKPSESSQNGRPAAT